MHRALRCVSLLIAFMWASPSASASGVGFAEEPEPDELSVPRPAVAHYSLSIGPHLSFPGGDGAAFMRSSLGMGGRGIYWLSPRFGLLAEGTYTSLRLAPLVPDFIGIEQYTMAIGARSATSWSRHFGLHAEALIARHSLRVNDSSGAEAHHAAALIFGAGVHIRVARDVRLELRASMTRADTSLGKERRFHHRESSVNISVAYEL